MDIIIQVFMAFVSGLGFGVIFNAPRSELFYCSISSACGWLVFKLLLVPCNSSAVASLFAAVAVTVSARFLAHLRLAPVTLFLIPGIIPFVPGSGTYYTMYGIINSNIIYAYDHGVDTLKIAACIAVGIVLSLSAPDKWFKIKPNK